MQAGRTQSLLVSNQPASPSFREAKSRFLTFMGKSLKLVLHFLTLFASLKEREMQPGICQGAGITYPLEKHLPGQGPYNGPALADI